MERERARRERERERGPIDVSSLACSSSEGEREDIWLNERRKEGRKEGIKRRLGPHGLIPLSFCSETLCGILRLGSLHRLRVKVDDALVFNLCLSEKCEMKYE